MTSLKFKYLFQALSVFSYVCWTVPKNVPVNQLFWGSYWDGNGPNDVLMFD